VNREVALQQLASLVPAERLEAARYLQFWAVASDIPELRTHLSGESVEWIRRALQSTLARLGDVAEATIELDDPLIESDQALEIGAKERARAARTVVHELEPIVGSIQYFASREFDNYAVSRTRNHIERLASLLRAIETLGKVAGTPKIRTFDLSLVLARVIEAEQVSSNLRIQTEGPTPLVVHSDPDLLELVVSNALRNAVESAVEHAVVPDVAVVYAATERDAWVTVFDNGRGLPSGSSERLFDIGTSTKEGHLGMGLALCHEAAQALRGSLKLSGSSEGASFEFVFPVTES
jgi:signal transduction histidine kinase